LYGVDISGHQGAINWTSLMSAKSFALMKATEGTGFTDPYFAGSRNGSRNAGILRGYYHYCRPDLHNSGKSEADYFLSVVCPLQAGEVLMCDYEPETDPADPVGWCLEWLNECYAVTGVKPLIYLNQGQINAWNWSRVISAGYPLNLACPDFNPDPTHPVLKWPRNTIKQYDWYDNTCPGIQWHPVDLDVFNGNAEDWQAMGGQKPTITTQPVGGGNCSGAPITLTIAATGAPAPTYQWRLNGDNISGATSTSYAAPTSGTYDCVATNSFGSATSNSVTVSVSTAPSMKTQPISQTVHFGSTATFTLAANGPSLSYQWRFNGVNITGATSTSYTAANPGVYNCVITNSCGSITSSPAVLSFDDATNVATAAAAKQLADGVVVALRGRSAVTRAFSTSFYVEDANRAGGIRVIPNGPAYLLPENANAVVYGKLKTLAGERYLSNALTWNAGTISSPTPLGITGQSAGLPLAQGLLVRMCGTVAINPLIPTTFSLLDGSRSPITVQLYGVTPPTDGAFVTVQGVVGREATGPVLRVNKSTDMW